MAHHSTTSPYLNYEQITRGSTRPDNVVYANKLAYATHQPNKRHWLIINNLLRYLKETKNDGIVYGKARNKPHLCSVLQKTATHEPSLLSTYSDAHFLGTQSIENQPPASSMCTTKPRLHRHQLSKAFRLFLHARPSILPRQQLHKLLNGFA